MLIKNFKIKQFLLQDADTQLEYINLLKYLDPIPTKNKIQDLTLGQVETIKHSINNPDSFPEVFKYMQGIELEDFNNLKIVDFYGLLNDIIRQIQNLTGMEEQELVSMHTNHKWEAVEGSKRLAVMGILPMVDDLANGNILDHERILDLPYMNVFNTLRMRRIQRDIEHDMNKIKTKE